MGRRVALSLLTAGLLAGTASVASAADLAPRPRYTPRPAYVPVATWTGFYIGGHFGAGWGTAEWDDASVTGCAHSNPNNPNQGNSNPTCVGGGGATAILAALGAGPGTIVSFKDSHPLNGFLGGGQVGYNQQVGWWLWGLEVQGSFADLSGHGTCGPLGDLNCRTRVNGLATFAPRLGVIVDRALIYMKGGGAWAHSRFDVTDTGVGQTIGGTVTDSRWGWMWGTGIEYAFMPGWSAKIEYNFLDFKSKEYFINDAPVFDIAPRIHLVKMGLNYKLGGYGWFGY